MRVVVGLGNPGPEYVWTRHNVGFMVVNSLSDRWGITMRRRGSALVAERLVDDDVVRLVAPQTFMNRSGEALHGLATLPADDRMVVVYDDVDLPAGVLRIRRGGGAGGHRGVASMIEHCGSEFTRVRVGIGRPSEGTETADFVLAEIEEVGRSDWLDEIERAADSLECLLDEGIQTAMNRFNGAPAS
jgi:PTH1 family peptidyl-tRNA hydrolase